MFSTKPNLFHIIAANIIAGVVSFLFVGVFTYSFLSKVVSLPTATLISYVSMTLMWIYIFAKIHRAIDINARLVPLTTYAINGGLTAIAATITIVSTWGASLISMPLSAIILIAGVVITGILQIYLYTRSLQRITDQLATVAVHIK